MRYIKRRILKLAYMHTSSIKFIEFYKSIEFNIPKITDCGLKKMYDMFAIPMCYTRKEAVSLIKCRR